MAPALDFEDWKDYFRANDRHVGDRFLSVLLSIGGILSVAGVAGIIWDAGWHHVWEVLMHARWQYLVVAPAGVAVSHLGYTLAYREVAQVEEGPELTRREVVTLVTTGFGPVSPRAGFALDAQELRKRGLTREEAQLRVRILAMLEYVVLAPATFVAALWLTIAGTPAQDGLLSSWVWGVPVGAAVALGLLCEFRRRGRPETWWAPLRRGLDAIGETLDLVRTWPTGPLAVLGMAIYWACDIAALGACVEVFAHHRGGVATLIVGYATGYALTRRSLPLGGAGVVEALLPFALTWVGYSLPSAILGVVAYRVFNLWLAMIPAVVGVRHLRDLRPRSHIRVGS